VNIINCEEMARFYNYPNAKEGPKIPYAKKKDENPTLRGIPLVILAWMCVHDPSIHTLLIMMMMVSSANDVPASPKRRSFKTSSITMRVLAG
jgi:hypothetical protein